MEAAVEKEVSFTEGNHRRKKKLQQVKNLRKTRKRLSNKRVQLDKKGRSIAKLHVTQSHGEMDTTSDQCLRTTGH